ncbi:MAG: Formamidopyrimidine-DNA glycosylase [Phycisphaerae bacterium]|nr:Formamidopyrimidine-DNA glycosylase [Phycisphaerae bacterium]
MAGRLIVLPSDRPVAPHTHFQVALSPPSPSQGEGLGVRVPPHSTLRTPHSAAPLDLRFVNPRWCMGGLWLLEGSGGPADPTAKLGPDPLVISSGDFAALLGSARRQIKALLLDQTAIAGVGNIYADESLFAAGIHPRARADRLSRPRRERLWAALRDRLNESIRLGGSTLRDYRNAEDRPGWFQLALKVYGRPDAPCPACAHPIRHATVAGRSTHYCSHCQKF